MGPRLEDPAAEAVREWTDVFMRHSTRDIQSMTRETGLSLSQVHTLFRLHFHSSCPVTDLGESLELTKAAASHLAQRLVEMNLVERAEDPADRRVRLLRLTPQGQRFVRRMLVSRHAWLRRLTAALTPEQQAEVVRALGHLVRAARRLDEAAPPGSEAARLARADAPGRS
jgi:DNA-binding MarR family transcriptional regulator